MAEAMLDKAGDQRPDPQDPYKCKVGPALESRKVQQTRESWLWKFIGKL